MTVCRSCGRGPAVILVWWRTGHDSHFLCDACHETQSIMRALGYAVGEGYLQIKEGPD